MSLSSPSPVFGKIKIDPKWKIAIVRSVWHTELTEALRDDAISTLIEAGLKKQNITLIDSPGSFELPLLCKHAIEQRKVDGCIALGVVMQGATHHARLVAEAAADGLMQLTLNTGIPIAFEVLFVDTLEDARVRSIGKDGKGPLAARTLLTSLARIEEMR